MIEVRYSFGQKNKIKISGHAGYADKGRDIVCAAVSGIFYALCGKLENQGKEYAYSDKPGSGMAECAGEKECFEMAVIGFLQIAERYPEHVKVVRV